MIYSSLYRLFFIFRPPVHSTRETPDSTGRDFREQVRNISSVLANLALDGLERRLREKYPERGKGSWQGVQARVHLIRYADDFLITGRSRELLEGEVRPLVEECLRERGLELSAEKTVVTHVSEGFDFLGQNIRRYSNGKLLIKPSKKNIHTFLETVREVVKKARAYPAWQLAKALNRMIRGWALYHRHVVSKRIFSHVDHAIFKALWQWALWRHTRKGKRWIMRKYFAQRGGRAWCFLCRKEARQRTTGNRVALSCDFPCNPASRQDQKGRESMPSRLGNVLRSPEQQAHDPDTGWAGHAALSLANTRR